MATEQCLHTAMLAFKFSMSSRSARTVGLRSIQSLWRVALFPITVSSLESHSPTYWINQSITLKITAGLVNIFRSSSHTVAKCAFSRSASIVALTTLTHTMNNIVSSRSSLTCESIRSVPRRLEWRSRNTLETMPSNNHLRPQPSYICKAIHILEH
ncbi:hypothetical protein P152DRAFT_95346 [Eremomyces bilateralis CBS 781.70]|uniref:Uncharacterized protein n=1 Tax=Eremomyces bilateralis CBS 781.70 TaxID=1392243 RepID=A0A6G1FXE2_9PEZI|nr:uncharacterized protein P152DRAFT_95346 [Eremomyces bilateralis CBS 781.70]KAF1810336.1 hypothetical protein P152DRAFT_95346 [Eremomyces bilateralis CBS 781.70]